MRAFLPTLAVASMLLAGSAASSGATELRLLSYNTHGVPAWIAGDDPESRFPAIGELTNRFDLVLLQEDFEHHGLLRERARHPVIERGNSSQHDLCPVCSGSGLTLMARPPVSLEALWNIAYQRCSGWILGGSDCLASKGFQLARIRLDDGAELFVANTHLDAGQSGADRSARITQLEELRSTLARTAEGAALVVAGDLNLDTEHPEDIEALERFQRALDLRDTGARAREDSGWLVLDYVLYRSGGGTRLEVLEAQEDEAFYAGDLPLSDHPALKVTFRVTREDARRDARGSAREGDEPDQRVVDIPPSTGMTAPVTYAPARDAR